MRLGRVRSRVDGGLVFVLPIVEKLHVIDRRSRVLDLCQQVPY